MRLGGVIAADEDGVVVVPASMVDSVIEVAPEPEKVELVVKAEQGKNPQSPRRDHPFNDETWALYKEYKKPGDAE